VLIHNVKGHYHFLTGIDPYSCGVVADKGYEIVHITLTQPIPWRKGFVRIDTYLQAQGLKRTAFAEFNSDVPNLSRWTGLSPLTDSIARCYKSGISITIT
jgi:hypothetical protein